jgi:hypothetical protein
MDVDAFATKFLANRHATAAHQRFVEGTAHCNTRRKCRIVISVPNAKRSVLQTVLLSGLEW